LPNVKLWKSENIFFPGVQINAACRMTGWTSENSSPGVQINAACRTMLLSVEMIR
jgi:hypothetical protein